MPIVQSNNFLERIKIQKINGYVEKNINYIISIIGLLVIANGIFYVVLPKYDSIIEVRESERRMLMDKESYLKDYANILGQYNQQYEKISQGEKDVVNNIISDGSNLEDLYRYFEKIGSDRNLILTRLDIDFQEGSPQLKSGMANDEKTLAALAQLGVISVSFDVEGINYDNLKDFIRRIQNDSLLMDINNLNFSLNGKTASFDISSYYLKSEIK